MSRVQARYLSTTLALVAAAAGFAVYQGLVEHPAPRLERRLDPASRPPVPPPAPPSAREILDRRAVLSLTREQVARLEDLDARWRQDSAGLVSAVDHARAEFSRFMDEQAGHRASVQEIQRLSAEFRELSAELRAQRLRHAEAAAGLLSESQLETLATIRLPERTREERQR